MLNGWGQAEHQPLGDRRTGPAVLFAALVAALLVPLMTNRLLHCFLAHSILQTRKNLQLRRTLMSGRDRRGGTSIRMLKRENDA